LISGAQGIVARRTKNFLENYAPRDATKMVGRRIGV